MSKSTQKNSKEAGEKAASEGTGFNPRHGILISSFSKEARDDNKAYRNGYENTKAQKEGKK